MTAKKSAIGIMEEYYTLTLPEITRSFGVSEAVIIEIVTEGIVEISSGDPTEWIFDRQAIQRIRKALQIHQDLEVNFPGIAIIIDLLEELDQLRCEKQHHFK